MDPWLKNPERGIMCWIMLGEPWMCSHSCEAIAVEFGRLAIIISIIIIITRRHLFKHLEASGLWEQKCSEHKIVGLLISHRRARTHPHRRSKHTSAWKPFKIPFMDVFRTPPEPLQSNSVWGISVLVSSDNSRSSSTAMHSIILINTIAHSI